MKYDLTTPVIIYAITCAVNGKQYIGITMKSLEWRWKGHCKEARADRFQTVLYRAMRLHGIENFTIEAIQTVENGQIAQHIERELIMSRNTLAPNGLNSSTGGEQWAGRTMTQDVKDKISAKNLGRKRSPETCQAMSLSRIGRRHTEQTKAKMRLAQSRPDIREAKSARAKARLQDPEIAAKLAASRSTPEALEKQRVVQKANSAKFSAIQKARYADPEILERIKAGRLKAAAKMRGRKGTPLTAEAKAMIGAANKVHVLSQVRNGGSGRFEKRTP